MADAAAPATRAAAVEVRFQPAHLVLGRDAKGSIRITLPEAAGAPVVETSLGVVENLRQLGPRQWSADYLPPKPTYPQVAIVTVTCQCPDQGLVRTWKALPLWGSGDAVVKTEPGTSVKVTIGKRSFGPARANDEGIALVPIIVPPGVQVGMAENREIDLGVPATKLLIVSLDRQRVRADRAEQITARTFVIDEAGEPRRDVNVELSATRGEVSAVVAASAGEFVATWTLPPGPARIEKLTGRIPGEAASVFIAELPRDPGPAARLRLVLEPERAVAGETAEVAAVATVLDALGNATPGAVVFTEGPGAPTAVEQPAPGQVRARYQVPTRFEGQPTWRFAAQLEGRPDVTASAELSLVAGVPHALRFDGAALDPGDADGRLRVLVHDRYGNPVSGAQLQAEAEVGAIEAVRPAEPGAYVLDYSAPWGSDARRTRVDVRAGEAHASTDLSITPRPRYTHLGVKAGGLSDLGRNHSLFIAAEAAAWLPLEEQALGLGLELGYFFFNRDYAVDQGLIEGRTVQASNSFVTTLAALGWRRCVLDALTLWAQIGLGATHVWSELRIPDQPSTSDQAWVLSGAGTVGAGWRLWLGGPFAEARYWVHSDPGLDNLQGVLPAWMAALGYRFELF